MIACAAWLHLHENVLSTYEQKHMQPGGRRRNWEEAGREEKTKNKSLLMQPLWGAVLQITSSMCVCVCVK